MAGLVLFLGSAAGLYFIGVAMVAIFFFTISGAWILLIGISDEEA